MNDNDEYLRVNATGVYGCGENLCNSRQSLSLVNKTLSLTPGNSIDIPNFGVTSWISLDMADQQGDFATFSQASMIGGTAFEFVPGAIKIKEAGLFVVGFTVYTTPTFTNLNHGWILCNGARAAVFYGEGTAYSGTGVGFVSLPKDALCTFQIYYGNLLVGGVPGNMWAYKLY